MATLTKINSKYLLKQQKSTNSVDKALTPVEKTNELIESNNDLESRVTDLEDGAVAIDTITPSSGELEVDGDLLVNGIITSASINTSAITLDTDAVTQLTSITTGVTVTKRTGTITTVSSTLAAGASAEFVVTATGLTATTARIFTNVLYTGNGTPVVTISAKGANSFTIKIYNAAAAAAFNNVLTIDYFIVL